MFNILITYCNSDFVSVRRYVIKICWRHLCNFFTLCSAFSKPCISLISLAFSESMISKILGTDVLFSWGKVLIRTSIGLGVWKWSVRSLFRALWRVDVQFNISRWWTNAFRPRELRNSLKLPPLTIKNYPSRRTVC